MTANETQVGGTHYKGTAMEHWDMAAAAHLGYFEGQITKYLGRFRKKNGLQDIDKAMHFTEKLRELSESGRRCIGNQAAAYHVNEWCLSNGFDNALTSVLVLAATWRSPDDLRVILHDVALIRMKYNEEIEATRG